MLDAKVDEVLTAYEDLWRQAALENAKQMNVNEDAPGPWRSCAWLAAEEFGRKDLVMAATEAWVMFRSPGTNFAYSVRLSGAMVITNNDHHWTWLDFANKFRGLLDSKSNASITQ